MDHIHNHHSRAEPSRREAEDVLCSGDASMFTASSNSSDPDGRSNTGANLLFFRSVLP